MGPAGVVTLDSARKPGKHPCPRPPKKVRDKAKTRSQYNRPHAIPTHVWEKFTCAEQAAYWDDVFAQTTQAQTERKNGEDFEPAQELARVRRKSTSDVRRED